VDIISFSSVLAVTWTSEEGKITISQLGNKRTNQPRQQPTMTKTPATNMSTKPMPAAKNRKTAKRVVSGASGGSNKPSGTQRILDVTLSYEMRSKERLVDVPRKYVVSLSGLKPSTFPVTISGLKKKGLIEYDAKTIRLTELGRSLAKYDMNETVALDNTATLAEIKKKHKLQGGMGGRLFDLLQDGRVWDRAVAAKDIGCENKGTLAVMLSNLKKNGIIDYDRHTIKLTDMCFPCGRPEAESTGQPEVDNL
jgi:hypothetical protein